SGYTAGKGSYDLDDIAGTTAGATAGANGKQPADLKESPPVTAKVIRLVIQLETRLMLIKRSRVQLMATRSA
ncbi:hypothetical protein, partial [Secundilactobacillus hailunensis]|uniref:hypothetical protein n=1 Tax=Secundilactobacillus hailunensis TaxID=2559923 RepID=UPI001A7E3D42